MWMSEEAWREQQDERTSFPRTIADEHRDWHVLAGHPVGTITCPWDACHPYEQEEEQMYGDDERDSEEEAANRAHVEQEGREEVEAERQEAADLDDEVPF